MKQFCKQGCLYLLLLMLASSCTVQKRVYMKGYNIEWVHSKKKSLKVDYFADEKEVKIQHFDLVGSEPVFLNSNVLNQVAEEKVVNTQFEKNELPKVPVFVFHSTQYYGLENQSNFPINLVNKKDFEKPSTEVPQKGLGVLSALSFSFGILALGLAFIPFGEFLLPVTILIVLFALMAVIFAAIVMRNKYHYKGVGFAITGYILGILALLIGALALVAVMFIL